MKSNLLSVLFLFGLSFVALAQQQDLTVNGDLKLTYFRSTIFTYGDGIAAHKGGIKFLTFDNGNTFIFQPTNETGTVVNSTLRLGGFGNFYSNSVGLAVSGQVGIGTDTPIRTLEVCGDASADALYFGNAWNNTRIVGDGEFLEYRGSWFHAFYGVTNTTPAMFIDARASRVGIGTSTPDAALAVKGVVHCQELNIDMEGALVPDYVFEENYNLSPLPEVEAYIKANKHLPEVPSAKEMEANGINVKEMNLLLLKKVEELTLHLIEMKKENEGMKERLDKLEKN